MTISAVSIQLEQRKVFGTRFAVQERIVLANPPRLANCFVITPTTDTDRERLMRVASLDDITDDVDVPINHLSYLAAAGHSFGTILPGDTLRVYDFPPEWGPADGTTDVDDAYKAFPIASVDGSSRLVINGVFWSKLTALGVRFTVVRTGDTALDSATVGDIQRLDPAPSIYKADSFLARYTLATDALDHMQSVQSYVNALAAAAGIGADAFLSAAPGNPVTNTYTV